MVERRRAQVDGVRAEPEHPLHQQLEPDPRAERRERALPQDALRPAGRARRVEEVHPLDLVRRLARGLGGDGFLVTPQAQVIGPGHEHGEAGQPGRDPRGHVRGLRRGEQHLRAAVLDDVAGLVRGQVPVDRGPVRATALRAPGDREVLEPVGHEDRDMIARPHAEPGEQPRHLAALPVEFSEGHRPAAVRHDHRGLVRLPGGELRQVHLIVTRAVRAARGWWRWPGRRPRTWSAGRTWRRWPACGARASS